MLDTTVYPNKYMEKNVTSNHTTFYYYFGGQMVALKKDGTLEYLQSDHLGSTSITTDTSGAVTSRTRYKPFGEVMLTSNQETTGTLNTERKFTGQTFDTGTDLYFYNARYYDRTLRRFTQADTIVQSYGNPQFLNRYSYVVNNPLGNVDPSGNICVPCIGAVVGGTSYTATVAIKGVVNNYKQGGVKEAFTQNPLSSWSGRDFAEAVVIGAATGGVSSLLRTTALAPVAEIVAGSLGGGTQYAVNVVEGKTTPSISGFSNSLIIGGTGGLIGAAFPGTGLQSVGVGIVAETSGNIIQALPFRDIDYSVDPFSVSTLSPFELNFGTSEISESVYAYAPTYTSYSENWSYEWGWDYYY